MGPTVVLSLANFESSAFFTGQSQIISACLLARQLRFQQDATCTTGHQVVVHLKADQRATWAYHGEEV